MPHNVRREGENVLRLRLQHFVLTMAALAGPMLLSGCAKADTPPAEGNGPRSTSNPGSGAAAMVIRGFSIQLNDPAGVTSYKKAIEDMTAIGCNWINFVVAARQDDIHAQKIRWVQQNVPSVQQIEDILQYAKSRGVHTMLMPIVLLDKAGTKEWRGVIAPPSWDEWFESYKNYITKCSKIAAVGQTDIFCVGSELLSTESKQASWFKVIDEIRKNYHGKLTYSANWDHYTVPTFWDKLDYIGMNNYNELAKDSDEPLSALLDAWKPIKRAVLEFGRKKQKPVFFTEVGWHNLQNTISQPWNYVATGPIAPMEQLHAYQAFVEAWKEVPKDQFLGAFIWEWRPGAKPTDHGSYSLQGEPALDVVKKWMQDGTRIQ